MNLHGIVSGAIGAVNPFVPGSLQVSTGSTTQPNGQRIPTYAAPVTLPMQVQALSYDDIKMTEGLNIQGTRRAIYIQGRVDGLVRSQDKGGDLITLTNGPNAGLWKVAEVLEQWPDWCKVIVTLQNGS